MENKIKCYCGHTDFCDCVPLKLTAVEWLDEQLQAKAMEKEQIEDAYFDGKDNMHPLTEEEYYNRTFNKQ